MSSQKPTKSKSSGTVRSRTGCQTCRTRKLKCDEAKPICGQCLKSHRECVRSEPITFRHHQNSSFGKDGQEHSLDSFFKYSQTYSEDDLKAFLPVPKQLTWIHVTDPTAEDANAITPPPSRTPTASDTVQQVAAHTLEALSTAAADQTSYPPQGTAYYTTANPATDSHPEYGFVQTEPSGSTSGGLSRNIHYYLSNSSPQNHTDASLIDPNLESTATANSQEGEQTDMARDGKAKSEDKDQKDQEEMTEADTRVAMALRTFNELQA
ncbi:uncharacterized protein Z520_06398 [Fonsecaea multimorphosa CBS 102226]|uniref:Zn(2)-C6 fungal-type domain-containing protein n=1 Tax=Fonsecaea multimorphosa CBS 102226 TaxID=1442371 RepID=A0A0D2H6X1_9EURO|nr:uncharacterized protein Z520_06398 [Fonsecaea multimorphosa CBS 102226]KIX97620.1 hypothetical protein Z520_06398 [Fonsecaea multimorphosa CBS 102226]OAL24083.1 hypothetical protein AYO22_05965 [Fonsecaea multimorphosa]